MTLSNLLDSEVFIPATLVIFVLVLIFAVPAGIAMSKKTNNSIYGDNKSGAIKEERNVKIVAKRTTPHPLNQTTVIYMVVFELTNGSRVELAIRDSNTYGTMLVGDHGILRYQGNKFINFERK